MAYALRNVIEEGGEGFFSSREFAFFKKPVCEEEARFKDVIAALVKMTYFSRWIL
ncbi:hypothetical protein N9927_02780 [Akkermansiaceae bacterium]|nr:hypothetical protein [Akkermansiaceae bacterium]